MLDMLLGLVLVLSNDRFAKTINWPKTKDPNMRVTSRGWLQKHIELTKSQ